MKRITALALVLLSGCSTSPVADVMDFFSPGRIGKEEVAPYGGVCAPRPLIPPVGGFSGPPPTPGTQAAGPVIPPPPPPEPVPTDPGPF
jgi:hypothetical protein